MLFTAHTDTGRAIHVPSTRVISPSTAGINAKKRRRRQECQSVGYPAIINVQRLFIAQSWTRTQTQTRTRILSLLLFAACQPNLVRLDTVTCERSPRRFYASFFRVAVYFIVVLVARIIERRVVDSPAIKQRRYFRQIFPLVVSFDANISSFSLTKKNAFVWSCPERKLEYLEKPEKVKIEK